MNSPSQNRGHLPYYQSHVSPLNTNKPPTSISQNKNIFKQSLMPDLAKKYQDYQKKQPQRQINKKYEQLLSQRNYAKGYEHLLSPRTKVNAKTPLNTYRTRENLSPPTTRQYLNNNEHEIKLEQNRSKKFISKLRQKIGSPQNRNQSSRVTQKPSRQTCSPSQRMETKRTQTFIESTVNRANRYQPSYLKIDESLESSQLIQSSQSPEKDTFEKKIIVKCRRLEVELQSKEQEIFNLRREIQAIQSKQISEVNFINSQHILQNSKKDSQLQIARRQLKQLENTIKNVEKNKNIKQKALQLEIQKYIKELKQSQQERNKIVLQFQSILKQQLEARQKNCTEKFNRDLLKASEENLSLRNQIANIKIQCEQIKQEKEDIFEESNLLSLQLTNYTKWNEELQQKIRAFERKLQESESINRSLQNQSSLFQQRIDQLQQILSLREASIKQLKTEQVSLKEMTQILRFQTQSLRNEIQSKERQFFKQKSIYLQEIEIWETKYSSCRNQKEQICNDLAHERKEVSKTRRLVDSLEERLAEQHKEVHEMKSLKDKYLSDYKEKSDTLAKVLQQMIYKDNEISKQKKKIEQLQQEVKLIKAQQFYTANQNISRIQQETFDNMNSDLDNCDNENECLQRIEILQSQLSELIRKFKEQKMHISRQHQKQKQEFKKRIAFAQKQLFRKEESFIDDKKRNSLQIVQFQQMINNLEQQVFTKNKEIKQVNEDLNIKEIKIKHLTKNIQEIEASYDQKIKEKQAEIKQFTFSITQEKNRERQALLCMIQSAFEEIQNTIGTGDDLKRNEKDLKLFSKELISDTNQFKNQIFLQKQFERVQQQCDLNEQKTTKKRYSPQKKSQSFSKFTSISPAGIALKCINDHEFAMKLILRTTKISSFVNLLNQKVQAYQTTIGSLQSANQLQPIKIHQEYMQKINELEKIMEQQKNIFEKVKQSIIDEKDKEKQKLQKDMQKLRKNIAEKEEQIEQMRTLIKEDKKIKQQMQQRIQIQEKQSRKTIRKLTNDKDEYKQLYTQLKLQKSNHFYQERQRNNAFSSNRQDLYPNSESTRPAKTCKLPIRHIQAQGSNISVQQMLEIHINELTMQNQHLQNQLAIVNNQLMNQKQASIDLNFMNKELQQEIKRISCQHDNFKQQFYQREIKEKQTQQQLKFLQQQNSQYQEQIANQISTLKNNQIQHQIIRKKFSETEKHNFSLKKQLQTANKQAAEFYFDVKNLNEVIVFKERQMQACKAEKQKQIIKLIKNIQEKDSQIKKLQQKSKGIEKVHTQLLNWVQNQQSPSNDTDFIPKQLSKQASSSAFLNLNQFEKQTISSLTSSFSAKIQTLNHKIQEIQQKNEVLQFQLKRQNILTEDKQHEILKKERQIQTAKEKVILLQKRIQKLEMEIEEWKFICQSNSLNKSISLQLQKPTRESFTIQNSANHENHQQKDLGNISKSPIRPFSPNSSFKKQHFSPKRKLSSNYSNKNFVVSMTPDFSRQGVETNLLNSLEPSQLFGPLQEFHHGNNAFSAQGDISFF